MTDLTLESLQAMLTDIAKNYSAPAMKPTKLIIGRSTYRMLMWRPKIQPAASIRKRKRAISWRKPSKLHGMLK